MSKYDKTAAVKALAFGRSKNEAVECVFNYIKNMAFDKEEVIQYLEDIFGDELEGAGMTYEQIAGVIFEPAKAELFA